MLNYRSTNIITLLFLVVAGAGMYNHELWRDEFEVFLRMRDVPDFVSLFRICPPPANVYYPLLYFVIHVWPSPVAFQIVHLLLITSAVFLVNKYAPFTYLQKIFFSFSYFVLFEYGIISRDYSMLLLLLFLTIYLITREEQNIIAIALSLLLLADHHVYGLYFSLSLVMYEVFYLANRVNGLTSREKGRIAAAVAIYTAGLVWLIPQYYMLTKLDRFAVFFGKAPLFMTLRSVWNVFFPLPETAGIHFWNTNILPFPLLYGKNVTAAAFLTSGNILAVGVSLALLSASVIIFSKKLPVLLTFGMNTVFHLVFLQRLSVFYVRYQGPLLIIFIYSYWLLSHSVGALKCSDSRRISGFFQGALFSAARSYTSPFVTCVLFIQFCAGIFCFIQDARYPFSASYAAAAYIREEHLNDDIFVGYLDYAAQPISAHLYRSIYYPQSGSFGTYVDWMNRNRRENIPLGEVLDSALKLTKDNQRNVLMILNFPLFDNQRRPIRYLRFSDDIELLYLKGFTQTIVPDEKYFLYQLRKASPGYQMPKDAKNGN